MNTDQFKNKMINPTYITKSMEVRCEEPKPYVDFTDVITNLNGVANGYPDCSYQIMHKLCNQRYNEHQ